MPVKTSSASRLKRYERLADRIAGSMAANFNRAVDLLYSCQGA